MVDKSDFIDIEEKIQKRIIEDRHQEYGDYQENFALLAELFSIVIFDKIKTALPALFRAGRLSSVEFKYLNWCSLNQLTQYYFKKSMSIPEFEIKIPTSQVIELAIKYSLSKKEFTSFETCV